MVKESELVEGLRARAKLIVEHEQLFPWRQTYARYLHVAEAVAEDTAQAPWDGLGGRLKALRREVVVGQAEAVAGQAKAEADVAGVNAKLEAGLAGVNAEMADMKADMVDMKAEVKADMADMKAKVNADMADMKALLEQLVAWR